MRLLKKIALAAVLSVVPAVSAQAALIEFNWVTTVSGATRGSPATRGETVTTTIIVDNGGSSTTSQTWTENDFVSYRIEGSSGWFAESSDIDLRSSSGVFSTDATGAVSSAGRWYGGYFSGGSLLTSWAGLQPGGWWNNGRNQVACTRSFDCVSLQDVRGNQLASNWTVAAPSPVPLPASAVLLLLGIGALTSVARKKNSTA